MEQPAANNRRFLSGTALDRIRIRRLLGWLGGGFLGAVLAAMVAGLAVSGIGASRIAQTAGPAVVALAALGWVGQAVWRRGLSVRALFGPVPGPAGWGWVLVALVGMDLLGSAQWHLLVPYLEETAPVLADWYTMSSAGSAGDTAGFAWLAVRAVAIAPLLEEVLFRGVLYQRWTRSWGRPAAALVVSSALFASLHGHVLDAFTMAVVATLLFVSTRSLWAPIAFHALGNALNMPGAISVQEGFTAATGVTGDAAFGWACLAVSVPLLAWFIWRHGACLYDPLPYLEHEAEAGTSTRRTTPATEPSRTAEPSSSA